MASYGRAQGPMKLVQTGLDVKGTYGHRDQFAIEGTVKGRTLTFTTREGNACGEGTAELWEDGLVFLGTVRYGRGDTIFAAYRKRPRAAAPTPGVVTEGQSEAGLIYFPDAYAGAFPMACNLLVQCEPDRFTDPELIAKQHRIAVAPIHGRADTVVSFSGGEYCYARMQEHGFPRLRFFAPEGIGHGFRRCTGRSSRSTTLRGGGSWSRTGPSDTGRGPGILRVPP